MPLLKSCNRFASWINLVNVRIPTIYIGERDLKTNFRLYQLRDLK